MGCFWFLRADAAQHGDPMHIRETNLEGAIQFAEALQAEIRELARQARDRYEPSAAALDDAELAIGWVLANLKRAVVEPPT
jgi:hypothetical protein